MNTPLLNLKEPFFQVCKSLEEVTHWVMLFCFTQGEQNHKFYVVQESDGYSAENQVMANASEISLLQESEKGVSVLTIEQLKQVVKVKKSMPFLEWLMGVFVAVDVQILGFVLQLQILLEECIRLELANRGYIKRGDWCRSKKNENKLLE